jgi:mannose-6-phosphate isomerase-like protein (cupin superfamily)
MTSFVIYKGGGRAFTDGADRVRIIVSGEDSGGSYSLLEWTVAAGPKLSDVERRDYAMHLHGACEEFFLIKLGDLEFAIDDKIVRMTAGDFVRVPPNTPHGYQNVSGAPVEMLIGFYPGGFERLFIKYRTDQEHPPAPGFIEEATADYGSKFGLANPRPRPGH